MEQPHTPFPGMLQGGLGMRGEKEVTEKGVYERKPVKEGE